MSKETSASDFGVGEDWRSQRHSSCPVRARPASGQSCSPSAWAQGPGALDSAHRLKEKGKGDDESLANVAFGPQGRLLSWVTALKGAWGWQGWSSGQNSSPGLHSPSALIRGQVAPGMAWEHQDRSFLFALNYCGWLLLSEFRVHSTVPVSPGQLPKGRIQA